MLAKYVAQSLRIIRSAACQLYALPSSSPDVIHMVIVIIRKYLAEIAPSL